MNAYYRHVCLAIMIWLALAAMPAWAAKLYKWVDDKGNISYQDSPPPADAKLLEESTLEVSAPAVAADDQRAAVRIYTVDNCNNCEILLLRLRQLNVPAEEHSLLDRAVQDRILSAGKKIAAPTMEIDNRFVNDITDASLMEELRNSGYIAEPETAEPQSNEPDAQEQADLDNGVVR